MTKAATSPVILHVQVIDERGQPIMEASVLFNEAPVTMPDIAALTDASGWVILAAPVPGAYTLEAVATGFRNATAVVDVGVRGEEIIEMALSPSTDQD